MIHLPYYGFRKKIKRIYYAFTYGATSFALRYSSASAASRAIATTVFVDTASTNFPPDASFNSVPTATVHPATIGVNQRHLIPTISLVLFGMFSHEWTPMKVASSPAPARVTEFCAVVSSLKARYGTVISATVVLAKDSAVIPSSWYAHV